MEWGFCTGLRVQVRRGKMVFLRLAGANFDLLVGGVLFLAQHYLSAGNGQCLAGFVFLIDDIVNGLADV